MCVGRFGLRCGGLGIGSICMDSGTSGSTLVIVVVDSSSAGANSGSDIASKVSVSPPMR